MKMKMVCGILIIMMTAIQAAELPYKAVIISPVADLFMCPMSEISKNYKNGLTYEEIPISGTPTACPRLHQLLANEKVTVIKEMGDEVKVQIPNTVCVLKNGSRLSGYWIRKKDLIPLNNIPRADEFIPESISMENPAPAQTVTLAQPWIEPITHNHFSAGTRFRSPGVELKRHIIAVFDPIKKRYIKSSCPIKKCMPLAAQDNATQRTRMITLLRSWTSKKQYIPYAFGGCSIRTMIHPSAKAREMQMQLTSGESESYFEWPGYEKEYPKTGIDCSHLVLLAARMCGIPYECKNSLAALNLLQPVTKENPLEIGDIIWIDKHLMIVADLERNTLIESRGYDSGYGKVQEIPLHEQFKDIKTYDQLMDCYLNNIGVERLNKDGSLAIKPLLDGNTQKTVQVKLLKLR